VQENKHVVEIDEDDQIIRSHQADKKENYMVLVLGGGRGDCFGSMLLCHYSNKDGSCQKKKNKDGLVI
jgi:hypothetical protein